MTSPANATRNFIYVAPTIELGNQTTEALLLSIDKSVGPVVRNVHLINSRTVEGKARVEALKSINEADEQEGRIQVLTTQTFLDVIAGIGKPALWSVILDEAFAPASFDTFGLGKDVREGWAYFKEVFDVDPQQGYRIQPKDGKRTLVGDLADGRLNRVGGKYEGLMKIAKAVANPASRCELVVSPRVAALISGEEVPAKRASASDATETESVLEYASYISPEYFNGFREVLFLSALFEQTVLYHLWTKALGVTFEQHPEFPAEMLRDTHTEQARYLAIGHLLHPNDTSSKDTLGRNLLTGLPGEKVQGQRVLDHIIRTASGYFSDAKFLLQTNVGTGYEEGKPLVPSNAVLIPAYAHGLNKYQDVNNVVALAITNPNPQQLAWVKKRTGMTSKQVTQSFRIHTAYQALGRCSIRKAEQTSTRKTALTAGEEDARFLNTLFPGSLWLGQVGDLPSVKTTAAKITQKEDGKTVALSKAILGHLEAIDDIDHISSRSLKASMKNIIGTLRPKVTLMTLEADTNAWTRAVSLACSPGSGWQKKGGRLIRVTAESYGFQST